MGSAVTNEHVTQQDEMFQRIQRCFIVDGNFQVFVTTLEKTLYYLPDCSEFTILCVSHFTGRHRPAGSLAMMLMKLGSFALTLALPQQTRLARRTTLSLRVTYCMSMCFQFVQTAFQPDAFFSNFFIS